MNKTDLVEKIAAGANITKVDAKKALDAAVAAVKDALIAGDKVALVGFGTFSVYMPLPSGAMSGWMYAR